MIPPIFDRIMIFYLLPLERASFLPQIGGFLLYTTPAQCDVAIARMHGQIALIPTPVMSLGHLSFVI